MARLDAGSGLHRARLRAADSGPRTSLRPGANAPVRPGFEGHFLVQGQTGAPRQDGAGPCGAFRPRADSAMGRRTLPDARG